MSDINFHAVIADNSGNGQFLPYKMHVVAILPFVEAHQLCTTLEAEHRWLERNRQAISNQIWDFSRMLEQTRDDLSEAQHQQACLKFMHQIIEKTTTDPWLRERLDITKKRILPHVTFALRAMP